MRKAMVIHTMSIRMNCRVDLVMYPMSSKIAVALKTSDQQTVFSPENLLTCTATRSRSWYARETRNEM